MSADFAKYRERGAYHYAATLGATSFLHRDLTLEARYRSVLKKVGVRPGARYLDAGSGEGVAALIAALSGANVVCVDLQAEAIELARSLSKEVEAGTRVSHARGDLLCLPFESGTFDGAFSSEVIEHIPDDRGFLRELSRVVKPGGMVSLTTPLRQSDTAMSDPYHVREYSRGDLTRLYAQYFDDVTVQSAWSGRLFRLYRWLPLESVRSKLFRTTFKLFAALFGNPFRGPTSFDPSCPVLVASGRVRTAPAHT